MSGGSLLNHRLGAFASLRNRAESTLASSKSSPTAARQQSNGSAVSPASRGSSPPQNVGEQPSPEESTMSNVVPAGWRSEVDQLTVISHALEILGQPPRGYKGAYDQARRDEWAFVSVANAHIFRANRDQCVHQLAHYPSPTNERLLQV